MNPRTSHENYGAYLACQGRRLADLGVTFRLGERVTADDGRTPRNVSEASSGGSTSRTCG